jgi:hypothetical protein
MDHSQNDLQAANDWAGYLSLKKNFVANALRNCDKKLIGVFGGNRLGKTTDIVGMDYVDRILGRHPIEWKNIRPNDKARIFRFCAPKLPMEKDGEEALSPVYRALKLALPHSLIKKDVTMRNPVMTIRDIQGGPDIYAEHVSYGQQISTQAGVPRKSVYIDEHAEEGFFEEQWPRVLGVNADGSNGDIIIGLTPVEYISWEFEKIYERSDIYYNSPFYREYWKSTHKQDLPAAQLTGNKNGIAVIRAATDDNPMLRKQDIDELMNQYDDQDTYEIRRYGIFHQISGRILKDYDPMIHRISADKYFKDGIPHNWVHARGIDYHEHTNWAIAWVSLSEWNEAFVWQEFNPSPDRMVTLEISREVISKSRDYKFTVNLVDPRMDISQPNTGLTPLNDMNRHFIELKREGIGTGGYWQTWDTKNQRGRDIVKERLKNARLAGKPFNNRMVKNGTVSYLPTLWILDSCPLANYSFKNWKWEDWGTRLSRATKDEKNTFEDKNSHFPITIECIFKNALFGMGRFKENLMPIRQSGYESKMHSVRI